MPKAGCTNGINGIAPTGNTDVPLRAQFGWYCPLPTFLLARRDESLMESLKAERCKVLLSDLTLVFFASERPKDGELLEDNSSSVGVSTLTGSFPLLRLVRYAAQPLSLISFPRS